ncbi:MAG: hypothetical protein RPU59_06450 [Candidatus Sedimenticola sp. (ex Thyasira tokunagai)]
MSRWIEQFDEHAFQSVWDQIKENLEGATVDDETITTDIKELARLKKVVTYLDEVLNGVDPELIPLNTWDSFNGQATPCLSHIANYNSNRNAAHIKKANDHADNLLSYVRPYMMAKGNSAKAMQASLRKYTKTINNHTESFSGKASSFVKEIDEHNTKIESLLDSINSSKEHIDALYDELFGNEESIGTQDEIRELAEEIISKHERIHELYNEVLVGDEDTLSTKKEITQAKESIIEEQASIEKLLHSVDGKVSKLEKFHIDIFGEINDDDEREGGLSRVITESGV